MISRFKPQSFLSGLSHSFLLLPLLHDGPFSTAQPEWSLMYVSSCHRSAHNHSMISHLAQKRAKECPSASHPSITPLLPYWPIKSSLVHSALTTLVSSLILRHIRAPGPLHMLVSFLGMLISHKPSGFCSNMTSVRHALTILLKFEASFPQLPTSPHFCFTFPHSTYYHITYYIIYLSVFSSIPIWKFYERVFVLTSLKTPGPKTV